MRTASCTQDVECIKTGRPIVPTIQLADEQSFLTDLSRMLWPKKTAANLAAVAGCSVRAAQFYLDGQRDYSGDALAAIVSEVLKRHAMRNVRVVARRTSSNLRLNRRAAGL